MKIEVNIPDFVNSEFTEHRIRMILAICLNEKGILNFTESLEAVSLEYNNFFNEACEYGKIIFNSPEEEFKQELENAKRFG